MGKEEVGSVQSGLAGGWFHLLTSFGFNPLASQLGQTPCRIGGSEAMWRTFLATRGRFYCSGRQSQVFGAVGSLACGLCCPVERFGFAGGGLGWGVPGLGLAVSNKTGGSGEGEPRGCGEGVRPVGESGEGGGGGVGSDQEPIGPDDLASVSGVWFGPGAGTLHHAQQAALREAIQRREHGPGSLRERNEKYLADLRGIAASTPYIAGLTDSPGRVVTQYRLETGLGDGSEGEEVGSGVGSELSGYSVTFHDSGVDGSEWSGAPGPSPGPVFPSRLPLDRSLLERALPSLERVEPGTLRPSGEGGVSVGVGSRKGVPRAEDIVSAWVAEHYPRQPRAPSPEPPSNSGDGTDGDRAPYGLPGLPAKSVVRIPRAVEVLREAGAFDLAVYDLEHKAPLVGDYLVLCSVHSVRHGREAAEALRKVVCGGQHLFFVLVFLGFFERV